MTLELGDVIAQIGGDGGGGVTPLRYVYELDGQPIPTSGRITQAIDANPGDVVAATLEWEGPETWAIAVSLSGNVGAAAAGVSIAADRGGMLPVSIIGVQREGTAPEIEIMAFEEGYTATRLTVIVIPQIEDAQ